MEGHKYTAFEPVPVIKGYTNIVEWGGGGGVINIWVRVRVNPKG